MTIRPPKYNSQGFTLIEMIVTVMVAGILMAIATPSFLSLNKPLRDGSLQFKSQLSLIRSKAISSGKSYRIRPKFLTRAEYPDEVVRNFVVEYAGNCKVNTTGGTSGWQMASQFDLDLPPNIGIVLNATAAPPLADTDLQAWQTTKSICFDNRGILDSADAKIVLKDFQGFNKARLAELELTKVGGVDIKTYSQNTPPTFTAIDSTNPNPTDPNYPGNPQF